MNWDMISALSTIVAALLTSTIGLFALFASLNPEWIVDKKLLKRIQRNRRLKDVCLSIVLSRCGVLVLESDTASCIMVKYRIDHNGWVRKTHLRISHSYQPELLALESAGILGRLEQQIVKQWSPNAFEGYQLAWQGIRFFDKIEKYLLKKYPLFEKPELPLQLHSPDPEINWRMSNVFQDEYHLAKVNSLQSQILPSAFPSVSITEPIIPVEFIPANQVKSNEFAIAFFPEHGYGFEKDMLLRLIPMKRPVNLGDRQFSSLKGNVEATIVSITELTDKDDQRFTRIGMCYTNEVLNAWG